MSASPFLDAGMHTRADSLAIVQLSRDLFQPLYLHDAAGSVVDGYAEGAVLNTRFGSFPHSTLLGVEWGSQVRASVVDTGSRGRAVRKRKRVTGGGSETAETEPAEAAAAAAAADTTEADAAPDASATADATTTTTATTTTETAAPAEEETKSTTTPAAVGAQQPPPVAASGFIHVLPPTPELWTLSLPHRTQVVYTSDYSYILHRLRARPGTRLIEAGSGSGSFTHAAARAVYGRQAAAGPAAGRGRVFSFEFHNERYRRMRAELAQHGLAVAAAEGGGGRKRSDDDDDDDSVVTLTNRDVYDGGFLLDDGTSPEAEAVFLDLPAPWRALEHLTRGAAEEEPSTTTTTSTTTKRSPLNPRKSVYLCTFSPCIEQVTRTVSMLRRLGWVDIDMVEVANKKIMVYRERPEGPGSGQQATTTAPPPPGDVDEAVARLAAIETRTREYNRTFWQAREGGGGTSGSPMDVDDGRQQDQDQDRDRDPAFLQGQLATRVEPEVKTHTSYLVFAVLPRAWTAADEAAAEARWPCGAEQGMIGAMQREERKAQKRQQLSGRHGGGGGGGGAGGKRERKKRRQEQDAALAEAADAAATS